MRLRSTHTLALALFLLPVLALIPSASASCDGTDYDFDSPGHLIVYDLATGAETLNVSVGSKRLGGMDCGLYNRFAFDGDRLIVGEPHQNGTRIAFPDGEGGEDVLYTGLVQSMALHNDTLVFIRSEQSKTRHGSVLRPVLYDIPTGGLTVRDREIPPSLPFSVATGRHIITVHRDHVAGVPLLDVYDAIDAVMRYDDLRFSEWDLPDETRLQGASDDRLYLVDGKTSSAWIMEIVPPPPAEPGALDGMFGKEPEEHRPTPAPLVSWDIALIGIDGEHLYARAQEHYEHPYHIERTHITTGQTTRFDVPHTPFEDVKVKDGKVVTYVWSFNTSEEEPRFYECSECTPPGSDDRIRTLPVSLAAPLLLALLLAIRAGQHSRR